MNVLYIDDNASLWNQNMDSVSKLLVVGGSFGLREFTQIRYDAQKIMKKVKQLIQHNEINTVSSEMYEKLS